VLRYHQERDQEEAGYDQRGSDHKKASCHKTISNYQRAKLRNLPVVLNGKLFPDGCGDSGSWVNCISEISALKIEAEINKTRTREFKRLFRGIQYGQ